MKRKTFSKVAQVKKESRLLIGPVRATTLVPHKNKRPGKHKQPLARLVEAE
jgi:hypothetical protein